MGIDASLFPVRLELDPSLRRLAQDDLGVDIVSSEQPGVAERRRSIRTFYVYIMANEQRTIYVGMTNDLERRVWEHKHPEMDARSFTKRHRLTNLVYIEDFSSPGDAIEREKALKGWKRSRKVALINGQNPDWIDLAGEWFAQGSTAAIRRTTPLD